MLYGFNKPVAILIKRSSKTKIRIPSNIIGIEQVRYGNLPDLMQQLKGILPTLFDLQKKHGEYLLDLKPAIELQVEQLKLAVETRRLLAAKFEGEIASLSYIDDIAIIVINKGTEHGVRKDMIFKVISNEKRVDEEYLQKF